MLAACHRRDGVDIPLKCRAKIGILSLTLFAVWCYLILRLVKIFIGLYHGCSGMKTALPLPLHSSQCVADCNNPLSLFPPRLASSCPRLTQLSWNGIWVSGARGTHPHAKCFRGKTCHSRRCKPESGSKLQVMESADGLIAPGTDRPAVCWEALRNSRCIRVCGGFMERPLCVSFFPGHSCGRGGSATADLASRAYVCYK